MVGAAISPIAIAVTLTIYNIYGTLVNYMTIGKLIGYRFREQIADIVSPCLLACTIILVGCGVLKIGLGNWWTIILQIIVCMSVYLIASSLSKVYGFVYIKEYIMNHIKGKSNADN